MRRESLKLRPGWPAAAAAAIVGGGTALWSAATADDLLWLTYRATAVGLLFFIVGLAIGSERLVGLAAAPILAGAVFSADAGAEIDLGRALIVGCDLVDRATSFFFTTLADVAEVFTPEQRKELQEMRDERRAKWFEQRGNRAR